MASNLTKATIAPAASGNLIRFTMPYAPSTPALAWLTILATLPLGRCLSLVRVRVGVRVAVRVRVRVWG